MNIFIFMFRKITTARANKFSGFFASNSESTDSNNNPIITFQDPLNPSTQTYFK